MTAATERARPVYFIKPIGMKGPIKIGCSAHPERRLTSLETWSPFPLEVVAQITGSIEVERQFHTLFAKTHERREWFSWSRDLQAVIDQINTGTFDLNSLPKSGKCLWARGNHGPRTPEQKRRHSYIMRSYALGRRSGFSCKASCYDRPLNYAEFDRYFAAPHVHGLPLGSASAAEKREAWLQRAAA